MTGKRYLVTGGTGFIGAALVQRLVKEGHFVRVLDNDSRGNQARLADVKNEVEFFTADIRDKDKVVEASRSMDSICHLAFVNGTEYFYKKPEFVLDIGVKGITNVIDACLEEKVPELILASSSEVYHSPPTIPTPETVPLIIPDPLNPRYSYAAGKIISEMLALNYGRAHIDRVVIFRPHNVYGPDMGFKHVLPQFITRFKELVDENKDGVFEFPIEGTGDETRAFVYIDDFVDGLNLVLEKGDHLGTYHIGTNEEVSIKDIAKKVADYFDREIKIIEGELKEGGTKRRCPDISKIKKLGYQPKWSLVDGIKKTADWYVQQMHNPHVLKV